MLNLPDASDNLFIVVISIYLITFIIQQLYYWIIFSRLAFYKEQLVNQVNAGISVVICARNEYHYLQEYLPLILEQDDPDFEVVVVNHVSDDDSSFLLSRMAEQYPHLKIVEIRENLNFFSGKKFPLSIGIKSAKNELIVLTDADCKPASKKWLSLIRSSFTGQSEIVLGYGAYLRHKGLLNKLIRFDTAHIAIQYLSYALAGLPYMGVGRNMAYRKSLFYRNNGFISHYRINSGDDDLFINKVASKRNTKIIVNADSFTYSESKKTFLQWTRQKRRHVSTARYYRTRHQVLLGSYTLCMILFYASFVFLLSLNYILIVILALFFIRMITQMFIFAKCLKKFKEKDLIWFTPVYEILLTFINGMVSISNLVFRNKEWK